MDTVYFGGGTPSILPPPLLGQMLHAARRRFSLAADTEITLEVNPLTATPAALDAWRGLGVNRLSFGMQSAVDAELYRLGIPLPRGLLRWIVRRQRAFRISPVT